MIVTRFAPSPTGALHLGSARTALFNWLYTKHCGGKFLLRIEDTDKKRSTDEFKNQILKSLEWLGITWDDDIIIQSEMAERHAAVAHELVKKGAAYYCYIQEDEIEELKKDDKFAKVVSPWRDSKTPPRDGIKPVIRMKIPHDGSTHFKDTVQGDISVNNSDLNDFIMLRADGTPTYLLSVVVDDHDAKINYIIRGVDHITNTFRQLTIYKAMRWDIPRYAHIPLIHGQDGNKLSKRHGAVGVDQYKELGYLPEALCNYLLRLGWGGDGTQEIIDRNTAISLFDVSDVSKSPAKFDIEKLNYINSYYIARYDNNKLLNLLKPFISNDVNFLEKVKLALPLFKERGKTILEMAEMCKLLSGKQNPVDEKSAAILSAEENIILIKNISEELKNLQEWAVPTIKELVKTFAINNGVKEGVMMQCLRASVVGTFSSPGVYEMMVIFGKNESLERIKSC